MTSSCVEIYMKTSISSFAPCQANYLSVTALSFIVRFHKAEVLILKMLRLRLYCDLYQPARGIMVATCIFIEQAVENECLWLLH